VTAVAARPAAPRRAPARARRKQPLVERVASRIERAGRAAPGVRRLVRHPAVALPGYGFATACAWLWGAAMLRGRVSRRGGVVVVRDLPRWAFGRGGTTIGAVYLTRDHDGPRVLRHEAVHRAQWRRYGLAFVVLYVAAGADAHRNRFEIEAGLEDGGYA
jgi:hypothetical protein